MRLSVHDQPEIYEQRKPVLDKLLAHATQDKYVYTIKYKNNGDLVMWDNTAVMHRATDTSKFAGKCRRDMRRTTVKDTGKYDWGENEIGTEWQAGLPMSYTKKE